MSKPQKKPPQRPNVLHDLAVETEAARLLLADLSDILGDDVQAMADAVEGETNLHEVVGFCLERAAEIDSHLHGIAQAKENLSKREARFKAQKTNLRERLLIALEHAKRDYIETAVGTISTKATKQEVVITDESAIPSDFWKPQPPTLDRVELRKALVAGEKIEGAGLDNGGRTVAINFR